ncbi:MAG TPA: DUF4387 domain-containing protein [Vineibacter sp.]|nr:DUF4387 domain-containing protein [Vineibacter sp.]
MTTIGDIATFVTSKNAGPFLIALDIVFPDQAIYRRFIDTAALDKQTVARLYGIPETDVIAIIHFDPAHALKVTLRRHTVCGAPGDTDVYGAQQHVPIMQHRIAW